MSSLFPTQNSLGVGSVIPLSDFSSGWEPSVSNQISLIKFLTRVFFNFKKVSSLVLCSPPQVFEQSLSLLLPLSGETEFLAFSHCVSSLLGRSSLLESSYAVESRPEAKETTPKNEIWGGVKSVAERRSRDAGDSRRRQLKKHSPRNLEIS